VGHCGGGALRLLALLGFALMLGACTKCDAPVACHDSPAPQ
jgi:hypothetical protein